MSPALLIMLSRLSPANSPGWPAAGVLTLSEPCFHIRPVRTVLSTLQPCWRCEARKDGCSRHTSSGSTLPPLHHHPSTVRRLSHSHADIHALSHSCTRTHSHTHSPRQPHRHSYTLTLAYSKSLMYKGVLSQECVPKSSLFISPTKLAQVPN